MSSNKNLEGKLSVNYDVNVCTCTGFLLKTWNASALIDKNLRNFFVSMFSSSSACFTYTIRKEYTYKDKLGNMLQIYPDLG